MQMNHDVLGEVVKKARERAGITVEALAIEIGVTERYMYRIENEGQKPSYEVLYKLIRILSIPADTIFYPEQGEAESDIGDLLRAMCSCDKRFWDVAKATLHALISAARKI